MFSNKDLRKLIIPLVIEQILISLMGTIDTMMVSRVGAASVSGVSCVDTINKLIIFLLTAVATGGTIICSQFLGHKDMKKASEAAKQVLLCAFFISLILLIICFVLRKPLLSLIFGSVEPDVMTAALSYFLFTIPSYPFVAIFNACSAIYRSAGNSKVPMIVSAACNGLNVIGNYILMFIVKIGVAGAAISTTVSMILSAIIMMVIIRKRSQQIEIGNYLKIRPDFRMMFKVMKIGVPTGVENSLFQLGKLVVQSTVATLGTMAITSNAIIVVLENFSSMPSLGVNIGLMTVAGHCFGAGRIDEAKKYMKKLTIWSAILILVFNWIIFAITLPVCNLSGFDAETTKLTMDVMLVISIVKPFFWPLAFTPQNALKAAGDVNFAMWSSFLTMWIFRVGLTTLLCRFMGVGLIGIWCGYFVDWLAKAFFFIFRYKSGKWTHHKIIDS